MVVVKVEGAQPADAFEVLINNSPAGAIRGEEKFALTLPSYYKYSVRIRSIGKNLVSYDGTVKTVGLYPGNVTQLVWQSRAITPVFGRLTYPDGQPVEFGSISSAHGVGVSNEAGYFQITAADNARLDVRLGNGNGCSVTLPELRPTEGYAAVGTLICQPRKGDFILATSTVDKHQQ